MPAARRFDWLFRPQAADEDAPLSAEARFAEALADLPAVERSALALSEIGGLDRDEIAVRLGTEPVIVEKLLVRARETVRASLATGGRTLGALTPIQAWWQSGASSNAARAAGVVAVAVLGVGFAHDAGSTASGSALAPQDLVLRPPLAARTPARAAAPAPVVRVVSVARAPQRHPEVPTAAKPIAAPVATPVPTPSAPRRDPRIVVQPSPPARPPVASAPQPTPAAAPAGPTSTAAPPSTVTPTVAPPPAPAPLPVEVPPPPPIEIAPPPLPIEIESPPLPPIPTLP